MIQDKQTSFINLVDAYNQNPHIRLKIDLTDKSSANYFKDCIALIVEQCYSKPDRIRNLIQVNTQAGLIDTIRDRILTQNGENATFFLYHLQDQLVRELPLDEGYLKNLNTAAELNKMRHANGLVAKAFQLMPHMQPVWFVSNYK